MAPYCETLSSVVEIGHVETLKRVLGLDTNWRVTHGDPQEMGRRRWASSLLLVEPTCGMPSADCFRTFGTREGELLVLPEDEFRSGWGKKLMKGVGTSLYVSKTHEKGRLRTSVRAEGTFLGVFMRGFAEVLALRPNDDCFTDFSQAEFTTDGGIVVVPKFGYDGSGKVLVFPYKAITKPGFAAAWDIAYRS